jgi:hypothetical protein
MALMAVKSLVMDAIQQTESASKRSDSDSKLSFPEASEYSVLPATMDEQRMTLTWAHYESERQDQHTIFVYDNECSPLDSLGLRPRFHVFVQNFFRPQALIRAVWSSQLWVVSKCRSISSKDGERNVFGLPEEIVENLQSFQSMLQSPHASVRISAEDSPVGVKLIWF